jgi:hypothetical protein
MRIGETPLAVQEVIHASEKNDTAAGESGGNSGSDGAPSQGGERRWGREWWGTSAQRGEAHKNGVLGELVAVCAKQ